MPITFVLLILVSILGCSCSIKVNLQLVVTTGQQNGDRSCPSKVDLIRETVNRNVRDLLQSAFTPTIVYRDCKAAFDATSGVYTISNSNSNPFDVLPHKCY